MKLLLYCTKQIKKIGLLAKDNVKNKWKLWYGSYNAVNSKIVAECDFEVDKIFPFYKDFEYKDRFYEIPDKLDFENLLKKSCLNVSQISNYLGEKNGYAIHIKNLNIFDKPKELSDVYSIHDVGGMLLADKLKKAPQNMQRISLNEWDYGTYNSKDIAILISIRPEWLCKILNDEKTIEVRKKVLKEML